MPAMHVFGAGAAMVLGILVLSIYKTYRRQHILLWGGAWMAYGLFLAGSALALVSTSPVRLFSSTATTTAGYLQVLLLVLGIVEIERRSSLSARTVLLFVGGGLVGSLVVLGVSSVFTASLQARILLQVEVREGFTGLLMVAVALYLLARVRRAEQPPPVGRWVVLCFSALFGAHELLEVTLTGLGSPLLLSAPVYLLWEMMLSTILGFGLLIWLFEYERVQAEKTAVTLQLSEEKFSRAFHASPDSVIITTIPDGLVVDVNEGFTTIMEYTHDEAVGRTTRDLNLWADPNDRLDFLALVRGKASIRNREWIFRSKTNQLRRCEMSSQYIEIDGVSCLLSVVRDVTEIRRSEAALRKREAFLRSIHESAPDYIMRIDLTGTIQFINRTVSDLTVDDVVGRSVFEFVHEKYWPEMRACFDRVKTSGRPDRYEVEYETPENEVWFFESRVAPILEYDEVIALTIISTDVTDTRAVRLEHERLIEELENKNAELERFAYTVSHDLKTPLVTINGFLGLLRSDLEANDRDKVEHNIELIIEASHKMSQLLDQLLELSRTGRLINDAEPISLTALAQDALSSIAARAGQVTLHIEPDMPVVLGDRLRLSEVYQNLLENAVKFMGDQAAPEIRVGAEAVENMVHCFVADNGIGIAPSYHEKVFNLFERLDTNTQGTGIGLTLVRRIVEVHGGTIWIDSQGDGTGTSLHFTLPRFVEA